MDVIYMEAGMAGIILAFPLFFASTHLVRILGYFVVVGAAAVLLMTLPATSTMLQNAYAAFSRAVD
jgi:hypothetical protein